MPTTFVVKVTKKGRNPLQWFNDVTARIYPEMQNQIVLSAEATAEIMQKILINSGYNLKELAGSIGVDVLNTTGGVHIGIGNIENFPVGRNGQTYWEAFNDGFKPGASHSLLPLGAFADGAPDANKTGGKWFVGDGSYTFFDKNNNKKVVQPLRYVDIGYQDFITHMEKEINKFNKSLEQASH